jgi:hypothetical protein
VSHVEQEGAGQQVISVLCELFDQLLDPRRPRGKRQQLASVLTVTVLAALAGACNFREAGDQAADPARGAAGGRRRPYQPTHRPV